MPFARCERGRRVARRVVAGRPELVVARPGSRRSPSERAACRPRRRSAAARSARRSRRRGPRSSRGWGRARRAVRDPRLDQLRVVRVVRAASEGDRRRLAVDPHHGVAGGRVGAARWRSLRRRRCRRRRGRSRRPCGRRSAITVALTVAPGGDRRRAAVDPDRGERAAVAVRRHSRERRRSRSPSASPAGRSSPRARRRAGSADRSCRRGERACPGAPSASPSRRRRPRARRRRPRAARRRAACRRRCRRAGRSRRRCSVGGGAGAARRRRGRPRPRSRGCPRSAAGRSGGRADGVGNAERPIQPGRERLRRRPGGRRRSEAWRWPAVPPPAGVLEPDLGRVGAGRGGDAEMVDRGRGARQSFASPIRTRPSRVADQVVDGGDRPAAGCSS